MQIVEIDSLAVGEGGGQVLRSAISLASILRKPVRVFNIRAGRPNPGLQAQHITGIESLARLVNASVSGLSKGSLELVFKPSEIRTMDFELDIGTAGSVTLVLQALLPVLAFAKGKSRFTVVGGTHVAWSPTIHYVQNVFLPIMRGIGYSVTVESKQYGWYPKGGGKILVETEPVKKLKKLDLVKRGNLLDVRGISCASNLPQNIVERQAGACKNLVGNVQMELEVTQALCPGTAVTVWANYENTRLGASSLGKLGKRAEQVGEEAARELIEAMNGSAAVDKHLADQILIYAALAEGTSQVLVPSVTEHMKTSMYVIQSFTGKKFKTSEGIISVEGLGLVNE